MAIVAIVGRPNVGKSSLFNRICREQRALVDDLPGVTRDRNYARVEWEGKTFTLVDTGGFVSGDATDLQQETFRQISAALEEADLVLFLMDAKTGLHPEDQEIARLLRERGGTVVHAANKVDGVEQTVHAAEFHALGADRIYSVSAAHGLGVSDLLSDLVELLPEEEAVPEEENVIRLAVVGRPNVGKSTLVNRILKADRVVTSPAPGTTRDAVDVPFERDGQRYILIDTAGIRRKGRTQEKLEKLSILKALHSIDRSHIAILLIDAEEGLASQDLHIAGYIQERYRGCIVGVNKWDAAEKDPKRVRRFMMEVKDRLRFLSHAPIITLSALTGKRVNRIVPAVREVFQQYNQRTPTAGVNQALREIVARHEPPYVGRRRLKFYYATQTSVRPPTFVLFCNYPQAVHFSYQRYLTNSFREVFGLDKTPVRLLFRPRRKGTGDR